MVQLHESPQLHPWPQSHSMIATLQLQEKPQVQAGPQSHAVVLGSVFICISSVGVELTNPNLVGGAQLHLNERAT